jgi:hypothetical protein
MARSAPVSTVPSVVDRGFLRVNGSSPAVFAGIVIEAMFVDWSFPT